MSQEEGALEYCPICKVLGPTQGCLGWARKKTSHPSPKLAPPSLLFLESKKKDPPQVEKLS